MQFFRLRAFIENGCRMGLLKAEREEELLAEEDGVVSRQQVGVNLETAILRSRTCHSD